MTTEVSTVPKRILPTDRITTNASHTPTQSRLLRHRGHHHLRRTRTAITTLAALALTLAALTAGVATAHANTCSGFSAHFPTLGFDNSTNWIVWDQGGPPATASVTCTGRFWVTSEFEFENNGTWHTPPGSLWCGGAGGCFRYVTPSTNCGGPNEPTGSTTSIFALRDCWGTNDGSGGGYWGAGNTAHWSQTGINDFNSGDSLCTRNWRVVQQVVDYATGIVLQTHSEEDPAFC